MGNQWGDIYLCVPPTKMLGGRVLPVPPIIAALVTYDHGSVFLWRRSDTLCTSGFVDDVIFEMSQGCSRSPPS